METKDEMLMARKYFMDAVNSIDECISLLDREESGETISEEETQRVAGKFMLSLMSIMKLGN